MTNNRKVGRPEEKNKNKNKAISLPLHQIYFLKRHKDFNLSKFTQLQLQEFINKIEGEKEV